MNASGRAAWKLPAVRDDLIRQLEAGAYQSVAAQAVGINPRRLTAWLRSGRQALDRAKMERSWTPTRRFTRPLRGPPTLRSLIASLDWSRSSTPAPQGRGKGSPGDLERRWPGRGRLSQRVTVENEAAEPDPAEVFGTSDPAQLAAIADSIG